MENNSEPLRTKEELAKILAQHGPQLPEDWQLIEEGKNIVIDPMPLGKVDLPNKVIDRSIAYVDPAMLQARKMALSKTPERRTRKTKPSITITANEEIIYARQVALSKKNFSFFKFFSWIFIKKKRPQKELSYKNKTDLEKRILASQKVTDVSFFPKRRNVAKFFESIKILPSS